MSHAVLATHCASNTSGGLGMMHNTKSMLQGAPCQESPERARTQVLRWSGAHTGWVLWPSVLTPFGCA